MGAQGGGGELAEDGREGGSGYDEGDEGGVDEAVLLEEVAEALVAPEELDDLAVELDIGGGGEAARGADEGEDEQLDGVEGVVGAEVGLEEGRDGLVVLDPKTEEAPDGGPAAGGEEASPVVADGEVDCGDLDGEEDAADGSVEGRCDALSGGPGPGSGEGVVVRVWLDR